MAQVVYASPTAVEGPGLPAGTRAARGGLEQRWIGWDGSVWNISDLDHGILLGVDGVEGYGTPPHESYTQQSPGVHGSRLRGIRVEDRPVAWPISLFHDGSSHEWIERDRALWRTFRPGEYGTWEITQPGTNAVRRLRCRYVGEGGAFPLDPVFAGWADYLIELLADDEPFWTGDPVTRRFTPDPPADFFNDGAAPVFRISSGTSLSSAKVTNPGDVEAWPTWRIEGPTTSVRVGLNGLQVEVPFEILAGQTVTIDTRPHMQLAERDGEDVTHLLGAVEFASVPPGADVTLDLQLVGTGAVTVEFVPRYLRAW